MPPKRKKIKAEPGEKPDEAPSSHHLEAAAPDAAPSSSNDVKLFEFKFTSKKNSDPFDLEGRLHIPLLVDAESGVLSVPENTSDVKGFMKWKLKRDATLEVPLLAKLVPWKNTDGKHKLRLGYTCGYTFDSVDFIEIKPVDWSQVQDASDLDAADKYEFISQGSVEAFADKAGGDLDFVVNNELYLRLYTVISERRPGQSLEEIKLSSTVKKPDWDWLESLANKHPSFEGVDIKSAIVEYKRFLALKIIKKDDCSEQFAPSPDVDKVWHLHLVFPEQYQQDILAFAKELKIRKPFLIPHCPFLSEESKERYQATYECINDKKLEKIVGKKVDMAFWPEVAELYSEMCGGCC